MINITTVIHSDKVTNSNSPQTKYAMSDNGRELHLTSKTSQHHLPAVEKRIRQMLAELQTFQFEISHPARALLELDNLINIRALLEYGQEVCLKLR